MCVFIYPTKLNWILLQKANDEVRDAVYWAIEAGYRHIDTAAVYGDETEVGQGIAKAISDGLVTRDQLFVTTKVRKEHR